MADSAGIIPSKSSDKTKLPNSINRTTSETLRLTENERVLGQPSSLSSSTPRKKTSFIITSITSRASNDAGEDSADDLDESHTEDISELVDNSRVTDIENETPSYSEDTFSKDDVFFNASSSLVSAPVIPTSSQYGLALVPTTEANEHALNSTDNCDLSGSSDLRVEVNESVINLGVVSTKHDPEMRDLHPPAPRAERFKVVKIESTEPFKRGRWICMDYLDHPNIAQNVSLNNTKSDCDISPHLTSEASDTISVTNSVASVVTAAANLADDQKQQQINNINNCINAEVSNTQSMQPSDNGQVVNAQQMPSTMPTNFTSVSPGQSLQNNLQMSQQNIVNSNNTGQTQQPQQAQSQSLSQVHMQQILANSNAHQSLQPQQMQQVLASAAIPQQAQQPAQPTQPPQQQQQLPPQQQIQQPPQQQPPQQQQLMQPQTIPQQMSTIPQYQPQQQAQPTMTQQQQYQAMQQQQQQPQMMQQQIQPQMPPVQQVHMQPNVQQNMQQMPIQQQNQQPQMIQQTMQQIPQQIPTQVSYSQPMSQNQQPVVTQTSNQGMMQQTMHPQMQNYQQSQMMPNIQPQSMMNMQNQPHLQPQYYQNAMPQTAALMGSQGGMMPSMTQSGAVGQVTMQNATGSLPPLQTYSNVTQQQMQQVAGLPQTPPVQTSMPQYTLPMSMPQPTPMQPMSQPLPSMAMQPPISYSVPASQAYPQVSSVPSSSVDVRSIIAADHSHETIPAPTAALLESLAEVTATNDEQPPGEDPESASGASAVAIDNKIEQAMDLVKSHLMFAVREEVEVLKEKIAELMERITQLESENSILRASANPETLAQLTSTQSSQTSNPP